MLGNIDKKVRPKITLGNMDEKYAEEYRRKSDPRCPQNHAGKYRREIRWGYLRKSDPRWPKNYTGKYRRKYAEEYRRKSDPRCPEITLGNIDKKNDPKKTLGSKKKTGVGGPAVWRVFLTLLVGRVFFVARLSRSFLGCVFWKIRGEYRRKIRWEI